MAVEILEKFILQWKNVKIFTVDPIRLFVKKASKTLFHRKSEFIPSKLNIFRLNVDTAV